VTEPTVPFSPFDGPDESPEATELLTAIKRALPELRTLLDKDEVTFQNDVYRFYH